MLLLARQEPQRSPLLCCDRVVVLKLSPMGFFSQINDDEAELLTGGVVNPSQIYDGSNYGQYKKSGGIDLSNPASVYGGTNYGQSKQV